MIKKIELNSVWSFELDYEKKGLEQRYFTRDFTDCIKLPTTTSEAKKGNPNLENNAGHLTDPYQFEGYAWYARQIEIPKEYLNHPMELNLERTRISRVWIDDSYVGCKDSLCSSHRYDLTPYITKENHRLTIMTDNTAYPTKGGHMTSADTQTNWNGITGEIYVAIYGELSLTNVKLYPEIKNKCLRVKAELKGGKACTLIAQVIGGKIESDKQGFEMDGKNEFAEKRSENDGRQEFEDQRSENDGRQEFEEQRYELLGPQVEFIYPLGSEVNLWSEHYPILYSLKLQLQIEGQNIDESVHAFGMREFRAEGNRFTINGDKTFLRGKHDGLIFPLTGYAPADVESWMKVMRTAKEYGINHYRFHTCCPPEAAFVAADLLGIYMEPELPFWGTVTGSQEENHDDKMQKYLISEGFKILDEFGNHPSFVMMSLGNELWGNKETLNNILGQYKAYDNRHLYTQGSNNFQFAPCILEQEDFFCGVRFSGDRLIRGSYAMCDAPQGIIQMEKPSTLHNYNAAIRPEKDGNKRKNEAGSMEIQYGTGIKKVEVLEEEELIPRIPVISHEIGQYEMFPKFEEIAKYTGVLKPRNFELFWERLLKKGFIHKAPDYFKASGRFAVDCYKNEIETALRSSELAGFQLLDLQDFSGQGTALVGILDAFMVSKGVVTAKEWRGFCSEAVLLAEFSDYVVQAKDTFEANIKIAYYKPEIVNNVTLKIQLNKGEEVIYRDNVSIDSILPGHTQLSQLSIKLPDFKRPQKLVLHLSIKDTEIHNSYILWSFPESPKIKLSADLLITTDIEEACMSLRKERKVLFLPRRKDNQKSIQGTYCTNFWNYPMFRSISEGMGKPVPIGTLGLLIDNHHPALRHFPSEFYSTPQWWDIINSSRLTILDDTSLDPIVQMIDNVERNHRLGMIFETKVGKGKLLVCTSELEQRKESITAEWLLHSLVAYVASEDFNPGRSIKEEELKELF